jgi:hypothetical protein
LLLKLRKSGRLFTTKKQTYGTTSSFAASPNNPYKFISLQLLELNSDLPFCKYVAYSYKIKAGTNAGRRFKRVEIIEFLSLINGSEQNKKFRIKKCRSKTLNW